jgi:hypothetical protein
LEESQHSTIHCTSNERVFEKTGGSKKLMNQKQIEILLEDIKSVYLVGYFNDDLTTEAEKWSQIEILQHVLNANGRNEHD